MREASGPAFNRLGVKGSLSAMRWSFSVANYCDHKRALTCAHVAFEMEDLLPSPENELASATGTVSDGPSNVACRCGLRSKVRLIPAEGGPESRVSWQAANVRSQADQ
jgi:hypothetical protein